MRKAEYTDPYRPKTSPKIRIRTIPTKILDCCIYDLTPISPTMPIEYPAASPVNPTDRPHARCMNPLEDISYALIIFAKLPLLKQTVILLRRGSDIRCYENSNDESIDRNDTGHDNWDE